MPAYHTLRRHADRTDAVQPRLDLVVIGNGMAGLRVIEDLLELAPERYNVTVFGAEPQASYNRIMLSPVLAGDKTFDEIQSRDRAWYAQHGIALYTGESVVDIDRRRRMVISDSGREVPYDRLVLATGSTAFVIPVPGHDLDGVISFRAIGDVERMVEASARGGRAAVIGGGLLGLEAAYGLHRRGMEVTVVHLQSQLMERQLDATAAALLQHSLAQRGLSFRMGAETAAIVSDGAGRVAGLRFKDDDASTLDVDLVVMAVGIRPNIELARSAGLHCDKGIVVNDTMQTFDPRIYAVGECVEHRKAVYGLVAPLWDQARVCANHLAWRGHSQYGGSVTATQLKVTGIDMYSAGDFAEDEHTETLTFSDIRRGVYKRIVLRDGCIAGVVLYGDTADGSWYFKHMRAGTDVSWFRDALIFGRAFVDTDDHVEPNREAA
ncbi:Nitrite reductase [NAD(P)H] large subunit [Salinisphaera hydrothermalis C41B8]|uniref:Nitrite reductase [NAD(P)H] large subunit n=1 Tax=Salinisphaera hydrothermalis (strain C41B8) TaxID=1304275 RepID=A0A084INX7_SALHC|nr:FAD-dependent oxidoreductase [Salinisphaera hydrothermalis]KEZ78411.1 Nitrite reductase [NAD(P)H] large subunit [Salinisphaera hydrothermalis C41B8]